MGDRLGNLATALSRLEAQPGARIVSVSRVCETEPWGVTDQPPFANAVAHVDYRGEADILLSALKSIEEAMGRVAGERFGPRPIDLDILLFGDEEWASERLTIPHPRLLEREFAVVPLLEIAPDATLPDGTPVTRDAATLGRIIGDLGPVPGRAGDSGGGTGPLAGRGDGSPDAGDWVAVGPGRHEFGAGNTGTDFNLLMYESFLTAAGIPVAFLPHRPNETLLVHPGIMETVRMLVPARHADEARAIIADLDVAEDR